MTSSTRICDIRLYSAMTLPCEREPLSTRMAPTFRRKMTARLTRTNVTGFISAPIVPAFSLPFVKARFFSRKFLRSSSSLQKARTTRTPVKFSRAASTTLSDFSCAFLYSGVVMPMMSATATNSAGITAANTHADGGSIKNAAIIAPNTIKGERRNRRRNMFTPV